VRGECKIKFGPPPLHQGQVGKGVLFAKEPARLYAAAFGSDRKAFAFDLCQKRDIAWGKFEKFFAKRQLFFIRLKGHIFAAV
jgi:hypothetical protein